MKGLEGKMKNIFCSIPSSTLLLYDQYLNSPGKEHILTPHRECPIYTGLSMVNVRIYILMIKFNS